MALAVCTALTTACSSDNNSGAGDTPNTNSNQLNTNTPDAQAVSFPAADSVVTTSIRPVAKFYDFDQDGQSDVNELFVYNEQNQISFQSIIRDQDIDESVFDNDILTFDEEQKFLSYEYDDQGRLIRFNDYIEFIEEADRSTSVISNGICSRIDNVRNVVESIELFYNDPNNVNLITNFVIKREANVLTFLSDAANSPVLANYQVIYNASNQIDSVVYEPQAGITGDCVIQNAFTTRYQYNQNGFPILVSNVDNIGTVFSETRTDWSDSGRPIREVSGDTEILSYGYNNRGCLVRELTEDSFLTDEKKVSEDIQYEYSNPVDDLPSITETVSNSSGIIYKVQTAFLTDPWVIPPQVPLTIDTRALETQENCF